MSRKSKLTRIALSGLLALPTSIALIDTAAANPVQVQTALRTATKVTKYTNTDANIRSGPGTGYKVVKTLGVGAKVTVISTKNGWSKVSAPKAGWIKSALLSSSLGSKYYSYGETKGKRLDSGCFLSGTTFKTVDELNLREQPTTDSEVLLTLAKGEEITLNVDSCFAKDSWVSNDWWGVSGWLFTHYLVATN